MNLIQTLGPTALTIFGGAMGWFLKSKLESVERRNEKLRDERAETYMAILEPFARLFTDLSPESQKATMKKLKSFDYRKTAFRLGLVGDDNVVKAWNQMWKAVYAADNPGADRMETLRRFGSVLLAIRKAIGGKTSLKETDMLQWLIKDAEVLFKQGA